MTIQELLDAKAKKVAEANTMIDASENEDRDFTAEEVEKYTALNADIDSLNSRIKRKEASATHERSLATPVASPNTTAALEVEEGARIEGGELAAASDQNHGFKSMGEFAMSAKNAALNVGHDERLSIGAALTNFSNAGTDADGGYAIPPGFASEISTHMLGETNLLSYVNAIPVEGNNMSFPISESTPWSASGIQAFWTDEAAAIADSKVVIDNQPLALNKVACLVPVTEELQSDSRALSAHLQTEIPTAMNYKVNDAIFDGNGVKKPTGFLQSPARVTIAKEVGQAAASIDVLNIAKMYAAMPAASLPNALWIANSEILPQLITLTIGTTPIFIPGGNIAGSTFGTILGRPVVFTEVAKGLGAEGDLSFVDLRQYKAINKGKGLDLASSMHLYFDRDMTAFRATFRIDGKPWAKAPVAPANGSQAKSAFVTLAVRA